MLNNFEKKLGPNILENKIRRQGKSYRDALQTNKGER